jgi:hypothetical protein
MTPARAKYNARPEVRARHKKSMRTLYQTNPDYRARQRAYRARLDRKAARLGCEVPNREMPVRCDLCHEAPHRTLQLDHCHKSKKFRGWLCGRCNKLLGMVKDDPQLLRAAAAYLECREIFN